MDGIRFVNVGKRYDRGMRQSLRQKLFGRSTDQSTYWALRDVSLTIRPGALVGLIGGNGAGKSTLLRLGAGVSQPTTGVVSVPRDTLSVLSFGATFDPTLTGRENATTALIVNGLTRRQARRALDDAQDFSELDDFFEAPVRTYSTGMVLRLAFAVAAQLRAEAFLVDEVLSVGDVRFQRKCMDHLESLRADGATILMASHDLDQVASLCEEAVWLRGGLVAAAGPTAEVIETYRTAMHSQTLDATPAPGPEDDGPLELRLNRFGSQEQRLSDVRLNGASAARIAVGGDLRITATLTRDDGVHDTVLGFNIRRASDSLELVNEHVSLGVVRRGQRISIAMRDMRLTPGSYLVDIGVYRADWSVAHDYHWGAYGLEVEGDPGAPGLMQPQVTWDVGDVGGEPR